jgi:hypothetical protein
MTGDIVPYTSLATSEYASKPQFMAVLAALVQGQADNQEILQSLPELFDLDYAVGAQEDVLGLWIGISRYIATPLVGVYFSWATAGLGWGQGLWKFPDDPIDGLTVLPDEPYRIVLKAKVAANQWDGTIPGAYKVFTTLFASEGFTVLIQDYDDMSMVMALWGPTPDAVTLALFEGGYFNLKPGGVRIRGYFTEPAPDAPFFAWGVPASPYAAGWGLGSWPVVSPGI